MKMVNWLVVFAFVISWAGIVQPASGNGPGPGGGGPGGGEPMRMERLELPEDLQAQLDEVRDAREALLSDLKALLEANADATQEERKALVEQWRDDNADALAEQREAMQVVRQSIREWRLENRPERPEGTGECGNEDPGQLGDGDGEARMAMIKEQHRVRKEAMETLKEEIENAQTAGERKQIIVQHREERMEQMHEAREEIQTRRQERNRDESVAALRERLQDSADSLRAESRQRDRREAVERVGNQRDTLRDAVRDRDRLSQ